MDVGEKRQEKSRNPSGVSRDGCNLATFGCSWREGVPAIIETNIYRTD
jgi:hypothetical protein